MRFATTSGATDFKYIIQLTEQTLYAGQTYTLSMIAKVATASGWVCFLPCTSSGVITGCDGIVLSAMNDYELISYTFTPTADVSNVGVEIVGNQAAAFDILMKSWKLEQGSVSTLANDAPADYGEQLALCQRFFTYIGSTSIFTGIFGSTTQARLYIPLPVSMRIASPTITMPSNANITCYTSSANAQYTITGFSTSRADRAYMIANATISSATAFNTWTSVSFRNEGYWDVSADL